MNIVLLVRAYDKRKESEQQEGGDDNLDADNSSDDNNLIDDEHDGNSLQNDVSPDREQPFSVDISPIKNAWDDRPSVAVIPIVHDTHDSDEEVVHC